jgi:hypothetical protein
VNMDVRQLRVGKRAGGESFGGIMIHQETAAQSATLRTVSLLSERVMTRCLYRQIIMI